MVLYQASTRVCVCVCVSNVYVPLHFSSNATVSLSYCTFEWNPTVLSVIHAPGIQRWKDIYTHPPCWTHTFISLGSSQAWNEQRSVTPVEPQLESWPNKTPFQMKVVHLMKARVWPFRNRTRWTLMRESSRLPSWTKRNSGFVRVNASDLHVKVLCRPFQQTVSEQNACLLLKLQTASVRGHSGVLCFVFLCGTQKQFLFQKRFHWESHLWNPWGSHPAWKSGNVPSRTLKQGKDPSRTPF